MTRSETDPKVLERTIAEGENPVGEGRAAWESIRSTTGHEQSGGKQGGPPSKAKEVTRPIVNEYREGKVKSTPRGG
jgi:hypothetical protein